MVYTDLCDTKQILQMSLEVLPATYFGDSCDI